MRQVANEGFLRNLYRGSKSPGTVILRNQEAHGATSAKRVPQDEPTAEIGQRNYPDYTTHSRTASLSPSVPKTRGFRSPYGTKKGDPIKSSVLGPAEAIRNLPTKLDGKLSRAE